EKAGIGDRAEWGDANPDLVHAVDDLTRAPAQCRCTEETPGQPQPAGVVGSGPTAAGGPGKCGDRLSDVVHPGGHVFAAQLEAGLDEKGRNRHSRERGHRHEPQASRRAQPGSWVADGHHAFELDLAHPGRAHLAALAWVSRLAAGTSSDEARAFNLFASTLVGEPTISSSPVTEALGHR